MSLFFANIIGWITANPLKTALYILAALGVIWVITWFACGRTKANVSQGQINTINSGNKAERQAELRVIVEDNADIVKTVDGRTVIADVHVAERNQAVDEKVKEADKKIEEAKQQGQDVTSKGLECILLPEKEECK